MVLAKVELINANYSIDNMLLCFFCHAICCLPANVNVPAVSKDSRVFVVRVEFVSSSFTVLVNNVL